MLNANDLDLFLAAFKLAGLPSGDGAAWPNEENEQALGVSLDFIFAELDVLLRKCSDDTATVIPATVAESQLPNLMRLATGKKGEVNQQYRDPVKARDRNQDNLLLFEMSTGIIWSTLKRRATKVS